MDDGQDDERRNRDRDDDRARRGEAGDPDQPGHTKGCGQRVACGKRRDADPVGPNRPSEDEQHDTYRKDDRTPHRAREVRRVQASRQSSGDEEETEQSLERGVGAKDDSRGHRALPLVYETTVSLMARPVDPHRRADVLIRAADYVLEHGLADLSLRPLSKALGTSPRMLLYDFGSKEQLIGEVLAQIRRREEALLVANVHTLADVWRWISAPEREPFLRLFFEVYVGALGRPQAEPFVRDWLEFLRMHWHPPVDEATATLMVAVVRGLLLDRLATGDRERTDAALDRFSEVIEAM